MTRNIKTDYSRRAALEAAPAQPAPAPSKEYAELRIVRVTNNLGVADWVTVEDAKAFADATHALRTGGKPLTHEQAKDLVSKYGNDPLHLVFQVEVWHGIAAQGEKT